MSLRDQVIRAPNGKFFVIWRDQPVCSMAGILLYFETKSAARNFFSGCEWENQLVDFDELNMK